MTKTGFLVEQYYKRRSSFMIFYNNKFNNYLTSRLILQIFICYLEGLLLSMFFSQCRHETSSASFYIYFFATLLLLAILAYILLFLPRIFNLACPVCGHKLANINEYKSKFSKEFRLQNCLHCGAELTKYQTNIFFINKLFQNSLFSFFFYLFWFVFGGVSWLYMAK